MVRVVCGQFLDSGVTASATVVDDIGFFILIGIAIASLVVIYYRKKILAKIGFDKKNSRFLRVFFFWKKDMPEIKKGKKKSVKIKKAKEKKEKSDGKIMSKVNSSKRGL